MCVFVTETEMDRVCVCVYVCVCVFIFREGILATLSYSGVLQPIRFRAKQLGCLKPLPGCLYLCFISETPAGTTGKGCLYASRHYR